MEHIETSNTAAAQVVAADTAKLMEFVGHTISVDPGELVVDDRLSVRPFAGGDNEKEQERIEALAKTIGEEGQLQAGRAFPVLDGNGHVEYHLYIGNRRRNAIALHNAGLTGRQKPLKMRIEVVDPADADRFIRQAIIENLHRKSFSPMDLALNIQRVRADHNWEAGKDTKKVAAYFGVSVAQITQHEKLLNLPDDVKATIHDQNWGPVPAQFLATDVIPSKVKAVVEAAQVIANQEAQAKAEAKPAPAPTLAPDQLPPTPSPVGTDTVDAAPGPVAVPAPAPIKPAPMKRQHLEQAARNMDALAVAKPLSRKQILDFFEVIADSPAYGHANAPIRIFAHYLTEKYAAGTGSDKTMMAKFDAICMKGGKPYSGEGSLSKAEKEAMDAADAAAKESKKAKGAKG